MAGKSGCLLSLIVLEGEDRELAVCGKEFWLNFAVCLPVWGGESGDGRYGVRGGVRVSGDEDDVWTGKRGERKRGRKEKGD
jgi:hypothetical protein